MIYPRKNSNFSINKENNSICPLDNFEYIVTHDKSSQTESIIFPTEKEASSYPILNEKRKRKRETKGRKFSPDNIRGKIFTNFNKKLLKWLRFSKEKDDNIKIISFHFKKNKEVIKSFMNKKLKELFVQNKEPNDLNELKNELLKQKLETKYEDLYKFFINENNNVNKDKKFLENFYFLEDYLKQLGKTESKEYISKTKEVATRYKEWENKKTHLFKKKNLHLNFLK